MSTVPFYAGVKFNSYATTLFSMDFTSDRRYQHAFPDENQRKADF
jgi:hypothetical protein